MKSLDKEVGEPAKDDELFWAMALRFPMNSHILILLVWLAQV
jgi:hypothetical protein